MKNSEKIFFVPIEPLEERYTEQWYRWWKTAFEKNEVKFEYVDGPAIARTIETGSVLDCYGTNFYKAHQLAALIQRIAGGEIGDSDTIFFADLWFPGIEALQYIRNVSGKKFKIAGILHAGTWDRHDFTYRTGMREWAKHIENGWLSFVDKVFVGSQFHKDIILKNTKWAIPSRITVTGLPFHMVDVYDSLGGDIIAKENIVVFPHRLDEEKRPWLFDRLAYDLRKTGWKFIKSKDVTKTKLEYYQLLAKAKVAVSFAEQETFGYAMLEALTFGCIPVVPNKLSYKEMPWYQYRFENYQDAKKTILSLIEKGSGSVEASRDIAKADLAPAAIVKKITKHL